MPVTHDSFCRVCTASCRTLVDVEDGHIVRILGDSSDPLYRGYTCVKGRTTKDLYSHEGRLTHALKRRRDGLLVKIPLDEAIGEIGEKLTTILDRDGPSAVGLFWGSPAFLDNAANATFIDAFMAAIGSDWLFDSTTIDQPGKAVAKGFHGAWLAPTSPPSSPMSRW